MEEIKAASISYQDYIHSVEQRGFEDLFVGDKQIKVDATDFAKIDREELFAQITAWRQELLHDCFVCSFLTKLSHSSHPTVT